MAANAPHCAPERQSYDGDDNGGSGSACLEKPITTFDLIAWKGFVSDELISMTGGKKEKKKHAGLVFCFYLIEYAKTTKLHLKPDIPSY